MDDRSSSGKRKRLHEDDAFHQVAQSSAYEYAPSSSTQPKVRYDVFLNHRGNDVKDTLAQAIHDKLSKKGVQVFLDREALVPGDSIPMEIPEAMDDACLHVAIFSKGYAESVWCLAELSYMIKTRRRIIPIFYRVKPSDLRWPDKENGAYADSFAELERKDRYEAEKLREWKKALQTVSYIYGYIINDGDWGSVLEEFANHVVNEVHRPQGEYPDAVGLDKPRDHVIDLLNLQDQSTMRIVVVYGVGGIGKTTLATAVFSTLNLTGYKHCRVVMEQDCSIRHIKSLQEQILRDLFNKKVELTDYVDGREQLSQAFRQKSTRPLFLFIDNALRSCDLDRLLPKGKDLSSLPVQSRMLITTRKLDETDIILHPHIQRCAYPVEPLPSSEAKKLVCKKVLGSVDASFSTDIDIDGLVECCGGIPLVLELVGSKLLSEGSEVSHWVNFLKETLQQGKGDLSERVVDCVYKTLEVSCKEAFLDVASFFQNKAREFAAKIVGQVEMKGLEDAALVKTSDYRVTMHDIVSARGKSLSKLNRITDIQSLKYVLSDPQKLGQLEGIMIGEESEEIEIQAEHLDLTSQTLRILQFEEGYGLKVKVKGQCKRPFESLRFLDLLNRNSEDTTEDTSCFSVGRNKLKRLTVCRGNSLSMDDSDCQIAMSLRELDLTGLSTLPDSLGNLSLLEQLFLVNCHFDSLPDSLGELTSLRILTLESCGELTSLPESLGKLSSLVDLSLYSCTKLKGLPLSVSRLSRLQNLRVEGCRELASLPETLGHLSLLGELHLVKCTKLKGLPKPVSQLSMLFDLRMPDCESMSRLPDKFGKLKFLIYLNVANCRSLRNLSKDFGCLTLLAAMDASGCSKLEGEAMDTLVELKSLMFLNIVGSPMLIKRWEQIKKPHPLLVISTLEDRGVWQSLFRKMMSWKFFHPARSLMELDGDGNLVEWIPSSSFVVGQAKVGVLFTMCDLCAHSNSEGLRTVKEKCTELLRQGFHIIYVEVFELGELRGPNERRIRQTLLRLLPNSVPATTKFAWNTSKFENNLFAYCTYRALQNGFSDKDRAFFCNEHQHVELTLALDALNTFLVEVKPLDSQQSDHSVDNFGRLRPGRSEQSEHAVAGFDGLAAHAEQSENSAEAFDRLPPTHSEQVEHSVEGMPLGEGFHQLILSIADMRPMLDWISDYWRRNVLETEGEEILKWKKIQ